MNRFRHNCIPNVKATYLLCGLLLLLVQRPLSAQSLAPSGTLSGTVRDATGAVVQNASITATNLSTNAVFTATSKNNGTYKISALPAGQYNIVISASGFATASYNRKTITVSQMLEISPQLRAGGSLLSPTKGFKTQSLKSVEQSSDSSSPQEKPKEYVRVTVTGGLGPMGYIPNNLPPTIATQTSGFDQLPVLASKDFNFPSLILYISASPLVLVPADTKDKGKIDSIKFIQETNRNPTWLDATFTLTAKDEKDRELDCCKEVQILGILPQQTVSGTKSQTIANVASAVNDVASALPSLYPGVQTQVTSATKAMNVVFQNLFPPQPVAYQYSYMNSNCEFGWFFRKNTSTPNGAASILGTQTGIVLLKTTKIVKTLHVSGRTLSEWDKRPTPYSSKLYVGDDVDLEFKLPGAQDIDYDAVTSLSMFPALISKDQAKNILHIKNDDDDIKFKKFVDDNRIIHTTDKDKYEYVTNASLSAWLSQTPPKNASNTVGPTTDPKEAASAKK